MNNYTIIIAFVFISFCVGYFATTTNNGKQTTENSVSVWVWWGIYLFYAILFVTGLGILGIKTLTADKIPYSKMITDICFKTVYVGIVTFVPYVFKRMGKEAKQIVQKKK